VNLRAPAFLARDFAHQVPADGRGSIVNIVDQRVWKLTPQFFSYTLTKAALFSATQTMAQALAPRIRVNAIGPGPTLSNTRQGDEDFAKQSDAVLLGHGGTPDEIADAVLYLAGANSVTGQMIAVDGGQHLAWETPDVAGIRE
jgi:NAD(P)-dependent dehydrogenase (short-subunit alcohol dehydrogenase family)